MCVHTGYAVRQNGVNGFYTYIYTGMAQQTLNFKPPKQVIVLLSLFMLIILVVCFRQSPTLVEKYYYGGFYQVVCHILHPVLNRLPHSFGDLAYIFVIILTLIGAYHLIRFLFTRQYKKAGKLALRFLICLQIGWLWFYCFWGLNYYRPPAAQLLHLNDTTYTIKDVAKVTALIIDSANALRASLDRADLSDYDPATYAYATVAVISLNRLSDKFRTVIPRVKPSMFSSLLNYMGTSGYYNPFTGEAQLNYQMPLFDKPFVACHEMGHQTGWAREDEANFAGYLAGVHSVGRMVRYSAYYAGIEEFMRYLRRRDTAAHHALRLRISPLVYKDFKTDSAYWTKYQGATEVVSGLFFDKFLKANNQPHGLRTYNRMILLTMAYYRTKERVW
ncbi:MAG: DUF3810 domain-containing protein [Bacteroidota bacterium]